MRSPIYEGRSWAMIVSAATFLLGLLFMARTLAGHRMSPDIYGAAVHEIPAEVWAGIVMLAGGLSFTGLVVAGIKGGVMAICGGFLSIVVYAAFCMMAMGPSGGSIMAIGALVKGVLPSAAVLYMGLMDVTSVRRK